MITEVEIKPRPSLTSLTPCTAFGHVAFVTDLQRDLSERLQANRQLVQLVQADLHRFKLQIETSQAQIECVCTQQLSILKEYLTSITEQQSIENERMREQILQAKKQNTGLSQTIARTNQRIVSLKESVGKFQ